MSSIQLRQKMLLFLALMSLITSCDFQRQAETEWDITSGVSSTVMFLLPYQLTGVSFLFSGFKRFCLIFLVHGKHLDL